MLESFDSCVYHEVLLQVELLHARERAHSSDECYAAPKMRGYHARIKSDPRLPHLI
jgi:hypothetical protein